jgi:hypothetical protein
MEKWGMSQDMLITIENGVHHYTMNPKKHEHDNMPAETSPPFGPMFYTPRKQAEGSIPCAIMNRVGKLPYGKDKSRLDNVYGSSFRINRE